MRLHVDWLERNGYVDGGCWAIFAGNGHLVAEMAQNGRNANAHLRAHQMCAGFNKGAGFNKEGDEGRPSLTFNKIGPRAVRTR